MIFTMPNFEDLFRKELQAYTTEEEREYIYKAFEQSDLSLSEYIIKAVKTVAYIDTLPDLSDLEKDIETYTLNFIDKPAEYK